MFNTSLIHNCLINNDVFFVEKSLDHIVVEGEDFIHQIDSRFRPKMDSKFIFTLHNAI